MSRLREERSKRGEAEVRKTTVECRRRGSEEKHEDAGERTEGSRAKILHHLKHETLRLAYSLHQLLCLHSEPMVEWMTRDRQMLRPLS